MQSVPITTNVTSLISAHGEVYLIQQSICDTLVPGQWFSPIYLAELLLLLLFLKLLNIAEILIA